MVVAGSAGILVMEGSLAHCMCFIRSYEDFCSYRAVLPAGLRSVIVIGLGCGVMMIMIIVEDVLSKSKI